ncbi:MAG TPA: hypothetical protein VFQ09_05715, partial [Rubrobacter sp.]|nr:hypothetical protein [Rubrobacter sp.]
SSPRLFRLSLLLLPKRSCFVSPGARTPHGELLPSATGILYSASPSRRIALLRLRPASYGNTGVAWLQGSQHRLLEGIREPGGPPEGLPAREGVFLPPT